MSTKSLTYRHSIINKILSIIGVIFSGSLAYISWINHYGYGNRMVIACLVLFTICLLGSFSLFYSATLTENEIIVWDMFRMRKLAWNDIYEVVPSSYPDSFSLSDRNGDVKLYISSQVKGYLELVWLIKQRRPDIWKVRDTQTFQEIEIFHQRPWGAIYYGLGSIGMIVASFVIPSSGEVVIDLLGRLLAWIVGLYVVILVARRPRKLEFQGPSLILSFYGGWKKSIHPDEVKVFYVKQENTRGGVVNIMYLEWDNGKRLALYGYKEGMPILASAFEKWMKNYSPMSR